MLFVIVKCWHMAADKSTQYFLFCFVLFCFVLFLRHNIMEIELLFHILRCFLHRFIPQFQFVKDFLEDTIANVRICPHTFWLHLLHSWQKITSSDLLSNYFSLTPESPFPGILLSEINFCFSFLPHSCFAFYVVFSMKYFCFVSSCTAFILVFVCFFLIFDFPCDHAVSVELVFEY